jgi:hypothetical protein
MKPYSIIIILLFCSVLCNAQTPNKIKNNALSLEVGKTGLIYNLTYDHKLRNKNFGFRVIAGSNLAKYLQAYMVGAGSYYLIGKQSSFLELGADLNYLSIDEVSDDQRGFTIIYPNYSINTYYVSANFGFRIYGKSSLFRAGLSPGFAKNGFMPGAYISFGVTF